MRSENDKKSGDNDEHYVDRSGGKVIVMAWYHKFHLYILGV